MRTQRCIASSLTRVGTSSKPPGRGYAKGDAKRWCSGFCTLMRWMVVRDLARMKLWLATRATPLTDMCLRRACRRTGCKAEGTVSKLLRMPWQTCAWDGPAGELAVRQRALSPNCWECCLPLPRHSFPLGLALATFFFWWLGHWSLKPLNRHTL